MANLVGTLKSPTGGNATGKLTLTPPSGVSRVGFGGGQQGVPQNIITIDVIAGVLQSPPVVLGNDQMLPPSTAYYAKLVESNGRVSYGQWEITGTNYDVSTSIPSVATPGIVDSIVAGANITVDNTNPAHPVISATGGGGGGISSIVAGSGISVDATDPTNPIVSATGGGGTPGGPAGAIQFNDGSGGFGGSADFTRDITTGLVNLASALSSTALIVQAFAQSDGDYLDGIFIRGGQNLFTGVTVVGLEIGPNGGDLANYGIRIADQSAGTNNWAIKTGLGLVEFHDRVEIFDNGYLGVNGSAALDGISQTLLYTSYDVAGHAVGDQFGLFVDSFTLSGGSATSFTGVYISDITGATGGQNFSIKAGLGLAAFGGVPLTMFDGLYVGPDESTLPDFLQGYVGQGAQLIASTGDEALGIEYSGGGLGIYMGLAGGNTGMQIDQFASADGQNPVGIVLSGSANGHAALGYIGLQIFSPTTYGGSFTGDNFAIQIFDLTSATNNYAFKSGAGMVEIGDATKAAGIHVQGAGAFDVDTGGTKSLLWLDADDATNTLFYLSNRIAGIAHGTSIRVENDGSLSIYPDDGNSSYIKWDITTEQWRFNNSSLQVQSWISTLRNTAPADGDIAANELADWFDPTNGAAFAMFKGKTANGTVVTGGFGLNTVSAPSPSTIVLPTSVYGGSAQLLGGPTAWGTVKVNGTQYKIPLY